MAKMELKNILTEFRENSDRDDAVSGWKTLSASQFMGVWKHFDQDGNGYIENQELDSFIKQLLGSMTKGPTDTSINEMELAKMRVRFLNAFDDDGDNRIDLREMLQILPTDETFTLLFQLDHPLKSSAEFMNIWKRYDTDCSGFIEANELKEFIKELLQTTENSEPISEEHVISYADAMLNMFDRNGDRKLQLSEMARLIPIEENFLMRPVFRASYSELKGGAITEEDINAVFDLYDEDKNGKIENNELNGFVKDLLELTFEEYDSSDMDNLQRSLLMAVDADKDGKISKKELRLVISLIDSKNNPLSGPIGVKGKRV